MARKKRDNPIRKITGGSREESSEAREVRGWLDRIEQAQEVRKNWRERFRCALAYEYLDGASRPSHVPEDEWISVNEIYANLLAELPLLYSTDPYFYIKLARSFKTEPMTIPMYEMKGRVRQSMLNYLKKEIGLKDTVRVNIVDAYFQYGVSKTHYNADYVDNPDKGKQITENGMGLVGDDGEPIMEPDRLLAGEAYGTTRVDPDNFGWDADAGPLPPSWTFLYERIVQPVEDVKNDKRFEPARRDIQPTEISEDEVQKERERRKKGKEGMATTGPTQTQPTLAVYYELYNLRKKEWLVVSPGLPSAYLRKPERIPKGIEKHPYSILRFAPLRKDSPYPIPPVSQWLDPQRETDELRSKFLVHRKRFNRKYVMFDDAFGERADDAADKLEVGGDGTVLRAGASMGAPVVPIQDAPLDQNHVQEMIMLRGDFERVATGSNQKGSGAGVDSATEAGIIENRVRLREGDKLGQVMDFIKDIGRKLDQLVQAHITRDQAVRVNGPEGEYWELVREDSYEEIEGEYEYSVNVGATTPQLPEIERAQWMAFLGLLANAPQLMLSKSLLKKMAELHHIEDEAMLEELVNIAKKMMGGQLPMPGTQGSQPNVADAGTRARSVAGGMASGMANIRGGG